MKRMNFVIACLRPSQDVKLSIFKGSCAVDGKEMYKKAWCTCKVVVLPCQAIAYFAFSSPPHLKLPIINDTLWSVKNRIFSGQIQLLLLIASQTFFRLIGSSFVLVREVENKCFLCTLKLGEQTVQVWRDNSRFARTHENNSGETVRRLGNIKQSIFLPNQELASAWIFGKVRWESVPWGFSALTWKLLSHLFSRADWLPLTLWGWASLWGMIIRARFIWTPLVLLRSKQRKLRWPVRDIAIFFFLKLSRDKSNLLRDNSNFSRDKLTNYRAMI